MDLSETEGIFTGANGVKLHYRGHRMAGAPFRAVVAVIESPNDDGHLYADLVRILAPGGYAFYGCTHQAHHRAPGQPGFLEEWNSLHAEVDAFLAVVRAHEPDAPLFLAGARLAGQLVMTYALHHPADLRGVIASSPTLHRHGNRPSLVSITNALSRIWPAFTPSPPTHQAFASGTPDAQSNSEELHRDDTLPALSVTQATASEISVPVLIVDSPAPDSAEYLPTAASLGPRHEVERWLDLVLNSEVD